MAKDLVSNAPEGASTVGSSDSVPSTSKPAAFVRYWHKPCNSTSNKNEPIPNEKAMPPPPNINIFQMPIASDAITTIEILKTEPSEIVELQSSDEDEVVEVALPPKPTITIESSDEECAPLVVEPTTAPDVRARAGISTDHKTRNKHRSASNSPAPSVVSSISDDFIRGDCVAFNITRKPQVEKFDFTLHGSDLIDQHSNALDQHPNVIPVSQKAKKKRSKKNKQRTPNVIQPPSSATSTTSTPSPDLTQHSFSTPQTKSRLNNIYTVSESSIPCADVYESDSNQSTLIESVTETITAQINNKTNETSLETVDNTNSVQSKNLSSQDVILCEDPIPVENNLVMGNVTGLEPVQSAPNKPFKNMQKGTAFSNKRRRTPVECDKTIHVSKESCRQEMERFYNNSWGGEDFDHNEIKRSMPRDVNLWLIDPSDKMISNNAKKRCHYCNRIGHVYEKCRFKKRICHMCGSEGHYEPRCPNRMCLRCGSANAIFSIYCRNCAHWNKVFCEICQQYGHPSKNCPDLWRRYHSTVENGGGLLRQQWHRKKDELVCSGCSRRGHLAHTCHQIPFSNLPLHSPFTFQYRPVYPHSYVQQYPNVSSAGRYFSLPEEITPNQNAAHENVSIDNPVQALVPRVQENVQISYENKQFHRNETQNRENIVEIQTNKFDNRENLKRPMATPNEAVVNKRRSMSGSEVHSEKIDDSCAVSSTTNEAVIQDSEVSNTSDILTSATIHVEKKVIEELKEKHGASWLSIASEKHRVHVTLQEQPTSVVYISGLPADQEAFQRELREFVLKTDVTGAETEIVENNKDNPANTEEDSRHIPRKKAHVVRMLKTAMDGLYHNLGEPRAIYKEFLFQQKNHNKLLKHKMISPKKLSNSRSKLSKTQRLLNMILLGQAGLADGSQHIQELYSLQDTLSAHRGSVLSEDLRSKVGKHYHCIFSNVPRDDYAELVAQYYNGFNKQHLKKPISQEPAPKVQRPVIVRCVLPQNDQEISMTQEIQQPNDEKKVQTLAHLSSCYRKLTKNSNSGNKQTQDKRKALLVTLRRHQRQLRKKGSSLKKLKFKLHKFFAKVYSFLGEC